MNNHPTPIKGIVIKQIILLAIIILMVGLILWNLSEFLPSFLGAITLYILFRKFNFYLIEKKKLKSWLSTLFIFLITAVVIILPLYFLIDAIVVKVINAQQYVNNFTEFAEKIQAYLKLKLNIDLLDKNRLTQMQGTITKLSGSLVSGTINIVTVVFAMYFMLYFMLTQARKMEKMLSIYAPLKKSNNKLIGDKIVNMVIANAVGIPVVALGQAIVALVGYLIMGAPSPFLLFALTFFTAMIPIVGAAIIYVPVGVYMLATGDNSGIWLIIYCLTIVGLTDNVLRFTLLKKLEDIHPLNTVFGIILGMNIFGFMGLVFGPILVSITLLLIQVYHNEFSTSDASSSLEEPQEINDFEV